MSGTCGHAAEGVCAAGRQRIHAGRQQEHQQRPGEDVIPAILHQHHRQQLIQEVPGWQEVGPDVERLIGQLKQAEDAISGGAAGMTVPRDDAIFMVHFGDLVDGEDARKLNEAQHGRLCE